MVPSRCFTAEAHLSKTEFREAAKTDPKITDIERSNSGSSQTSRRKFLSSTACAMNISEQEYSVNDISIINLEADDTRGNVSTYVPMTTFQVPKCCQYSNIIGFFKVATFYFDDCFAQSWHSLDDLQE
ncbi:unnamed protein product, partial [Ranitomeya imitator]